MATQIAQALNVSLDYLVGSTDLLLDNNIIKKYRRFSNSIPKTKNTCLP